MSKSTTLANISITDSLTISNFATLSIVPSRDQAQEYSHERIAPVINTSPVIQTFYISHRLSQNVFTKKFKNQSKIYIRYADRHTVDSKRGLSADRCIFDETQDLDKEVIPIILKTMSRSIYKREMYAGTPKRTQGTLEDVWNLSTKHEFMPKCKHCNKWNLLNEDNIAESGLVCAYCGKPLNPKIGKWILTGSPTAKIFGFRFCALHFFGAPWLNWEDDIIDFRKNKPPAVFYNEVLGLPYDEGVSPITEVQIRKCCDEDLSFQDLLLRIPFSYGGLDHGPATSNESNTVLCAVGVDTKTGKLAVGFGKKYLGKEADQAFIHRDIPVKFKTLKMKRLGADYGIGESSNSEISRRLGPGKLVQYFYTEQKEQATWNKKLNAYTLKKRLILDEFLFRAIKEETIIFPRWAEFEPFARDILNEQIEYNLERNKSKYVNVGPDDFLHALIFAILTLRLEMLKN